MLDRQIISSLLRPEAYPEPTRSVSLIQTHISYLFMTDRYVYKVKKGVNFGFLDFSTLEKRLHFCNEEIRLNARLCPGIYQKVVPLVRTSRTVCFDREGEVLDYAVKMVRLPADRMLEGLVERNEVTPGEMREVARTIADFHARSERGPAIDEWGSPERLSVNCAENFRQLAPYLGRTITGHLLAELQKWTDGWLARRRDLLQARITEGFIRDCDGDIHLANICLWDHPYIFDCIEFNERFRFSDTAADVAFLLMDLDHHGRQDLADLVLDEYIHASGDRGIMDVLPFYKVYRAVVRAKIASFMLDDGGIDDGQKQAASAQARRYLDLAREYISLCPVQPRLIITCGLMGTGKSHVARILAPRVSAEIVSSDRLRKEMAGIPLDARAREGYNEGIYSPAFSNAVYLELLNRARSALADGRSIIVDASFHRRSDRILFQQLAESFGALFAIVETRCDEETIRQRLKERARHRAAISDGRWEIYPQQKRDFETPAEVSSHIVLDTTASTADLATQLSHFFGAHHGTKAHIGPSYKASA